MKTIEYDGTQEEQERVESEQKANGLYLIEVQNLMSGNFLIFDDKPYTPSVAPETQFEKATARITALEQADLDNKEMINGLAATVWGESNA